MEILEKPVKSAKPYYTFFNPGVIRIPWIGMTLACGRCRTTFRLESKSGEKLGDEKEILAHIESGEANGEDVLAYYVRCPECCITSVRIGSTTPIPEDYVRSERIC